MPLAVVEAPVSDIANQLEQLFNAHHRLVFRTAYRVTGNAADAEDVLQTVFLRLLQRDESAGALKDQESYLRRAAVNVALDVVQLRQEGKGIPSDDLPASPGRHDPLEMRDCLRRAIARLKPRDAEIFALRFLEGYSNPEISRMLGVSQVLIAVKLHRTRRRLQKEIRSYWSGAL